MNGQLGGKKRDYANVPLFFAMDRSDAGSWNREKEILRKKIEQDMTHSLECGWAPALVDYAINNAYEFFLRDIGESFSFPLDFRDSWGRSLAHLLFEPVQSRQFRSVSTDAIVRLARFLSASGVALEEPYPELPEGFSSVREGLSLWLYAADQKRWDLALELMPELPGSLRAGKEDEVFREVCAQEGWAVSSGAGRLLDAWITKRGTFQGCEVPLARYWSFLSRHSMEKVLRDAGVPDGDGRTAFHRWLSQWDDPVFPDCARFALKNREVLSRPDAWGECPWEVWMLAWSQCAAPVEDLGVHMSLWGWWESEGGMQMTSLLSDEMKRDAIANWRTFGWGL